jgi:hypothetical protein
MLNEKEIRFTDISKDFAKFVESYRPSTLIVWHHLGTGTWEFQFDGLNVKERLGRDASSKLYEAVRKFAKKETTLYSVEYEPGSHHGPSQDDPSKRTFIRK